MNIDRIKKNTIQNANGCWIWQRSCNSAGYGQLTEDKKYWLSHVYAYACENGLPERGSVVRHLCHERRCCNPEHLRSGSHADNWADSEGLHREASARSRSFWTVGDSTYPTIREAVKETGISSASLVKFTRGGVFDAAAYRSGCAKAGWRPKI